MDATTLEANAAMRSIVRRDTEESLPGVLGPGLAKASWDRDSPTREATWRAWTAIARRRPPTKSWKHPGESRCEGRQIKEWRNPPRTQSRGMRWTWETGALVAVILQDADQGDTTTIIETAIAAADNQIEDAQAELEEPQPLEEIIADKGYHSNQDDVLRVVEI